MSQQELQNRVGNLKVALFARSDMFDLTAPLPVLGLGSRFLPDAYYKENRVTFGWRSHRKWVKKSRSVERHCSIAMLFFC